jgi:hypothetical protein
MRHRPADEFPWFVVEAASFGRDICLNSLQLANGFREVSMR